MERVADEDVREVERLNNEAEAEDEAERQRLAAQQNETEDIEDDNSIDELFGDDAEGDTEHAVSTPTTEIVKIDAKNKPIEFSGSLKAELGAYIYAYPFSESKPVATFSNTLKFIGRPATDFSQPLVNGLDGEVVEVARHLLAITADERDGRSIVKQVDGSCHLVNGNIELL